MNLGTRFQGDCSNTPIANFWATHCALALRFQQLFEDAWPWQWHMFHGFSKLMLQVPPSGFTAAHFTTKYWIAACKFADCPKKRRREQKLGSSLHAILSLEQLLETASILFQCFRLVSSCTNPCSSMLAHWWCLLCRPEQKSFWEGGAREKKKLATGRCKHTHKAMEEILFSIGGTGMDKKPKWNFQISIADDSPTTPNLISLPASGAMHSDRPHAEPFKMFRSVPSAFSRVRTKTTATAQH